MSKRKAILFLTALVAGAAVAAVAIRRRQKDLGALSEALSRGPVVESVYGIGTVTARNSYQLKLGVTSTISKLFVNEGDFVKKGQKLVEIDAGTTFPAPFDGTITYLPVKAGETVFAQAVILTLADLSDRYVVVSLEQRGAVRVRQGQKARMSFDSMRDTSFEGVVQSVYSNENNFLVRIGVTDLPPQLLPGMTADVAIVIAEHQNVLSVPAAAIERGRVLVARGAGRVETVDIRTGIIDGAMAEVISGDLKEGDRVYLRRKAGS
jgi:multidrug efflux pump subunit AcrA (membrane-fusion protein)